MKLARLDSLTKGWFIGSFTPTLCDTNAVEVAVKKYSAGSTDEWHYHKIATEYTVIVSGEVEMNGQRFREGDIVVVAPGEGVNFVAILPTVTVVVKLPGVSNDKYIK